MTETADPVAGDPLPRGRGVLSLLFGIAVGSLLGRMRWRRARGIVIVGLGIELRH